MSTRHPLDGARLKVVRAEKHLNALQDEIGRYLDTHPYEFPTEHEGDVVTAKSAVVKTEPPLDLGCIFGDCLTNLRSSLDYIAWELAVRHSPAPVVEGKDIIYFPLAKDATDFGTKRRADLARYSIPAPALDLIESVQPYHTGYESLRLLTTLGNKDKHRLPLLTVGQADTSSIQVTVTGAPIPTLRMQPPGSACVVEMFNTTAGEVRRLTPKDLEEMQKPGYNPFARLPGWPGGPTVDTPSPAPPEQQPRSVKVHGQVTVFVAIKDAPVPLVPIERALEQLVKCVANIVPRFEPFF
jgi:hypothetical protein